MRKVLKKKKINEDLTVQSATVSADTNLHKDETNNETETSDSQTENKSEEKKEEVEQVKKPSISSEDVDGLSDEDIMNYVYFNIPDDIDDTTRQKLYQRADDIRVRRTNNSMSLSDMEKLAKSVIANANTFVSNLKN